MPPDDLHSPTPSPPKQHVVCLPNRVQPLLLTHAQLPLPVGMHRRRLPPAVLQHGAAAEHTELSAPQRQFTLLGSGLVGSHGLSHTLFSLQTRPEQQGVVSHELFSLTQMHAPVAGSQVPLGQVPAVNSQAPVVGLQVPPVWQPVGVQVTAV